MTETNMNTSNPYDGERIAGTVGFPLPGVELRVALLGELSDLLGHPRPLLRRVHDQAVVLPDPDHRSVGKGASEVHRKDQPTLRVQGVSVLPQKVLHVPSPEAPPGASHVLGAPTPPATDGR